MRRLSRSLRGAIATGMIVVVAGIGVGASAPSPPAGPPVHGAVAGLEAGDAVRRADLDRLEEAFGTFVVSPASARRQQLDVVVDEAMVANPALTPAQVERVRRFLRTVHEALEELARSEALRSQRERDLLNRLLQMATRPAPAATPTASPEVR
jgi:hypothetical protein